MKNKYYRRAKRLRQQGFGVVPVHRDGSKRVALTSWTKYQDELCNDRDLENWFADEEPFAIGIICGDVSGNLEILDFDDETLIDPFEETLQSDSSALFQKLIRVETGSGKRHYIYRCSSSPGGRRILAQNSPAPGKTKGKVAIELRGNGCMTIAAGSPSDTHASGKPYRRIGGPQFADIQTLTTRERKQLHRTCRSLSRWSDDTKSKKCEPHNTDSPVDIDRPGDHFNESATWEEILESIDFELVREDRDGSQFWRRPGGSHPWSVRTGLHSRNGRDLMRVFSTDTEYFEPDRSYDKFAAFAAIHHKGDLGVAAADLARQGFGNQAEGDVDENADKIVVSPFSKIRSRKVRWLWRDRIPIGKLTVLSGDPSVGKSFSFCDIAARVSTGASFPDGAPGGPG